MTKFDKVNVPQHLAGLLEAHSKISKRLEIGGDDLTPVEIMKLKKVKLMLRTAILGASYRVNKDPDITEATLHPLSVDTLRILERKFKNKLDGMKALVGPSSRDILKLQCLLSRVTNSLGTDSIFYQPLRLGEAA